MTERARPSGARLIAATSTTAYAVAVATGLLAGYGRPAWWAAPVLALLVAVGEIAVVHLVFGRQRWVFSCTDSAIAAALVLASGAWPIVPVMVGVLAAQCHRRLPARKAIFNVAQFGCGTAVAAITASYSGGGVVGACAGMAAFWLVNYTLVAIAVAATSQRSFWPLVLDSAPLSALHAAGNASLGLLAGWLAVTAPAGLLGLVVPLVLLWSSYDQQTRRAAEARLYAELARGQQQASARSTDVSVEVVLTAAARLFGGADVEMVLLTDDGSVHYAGNELGVARRRVDPEAFDRPWVLAALGARGVTTGVQDGRAYCSAVLGTAEAPLAVLRALRPTGAGSFERREALLAEVLVGQAESWLSMADLAARHGAAVDRATAADQAARALGDLGAHTLPALHVLHESAARLARLAATPGGPDAVGDIVGELHVVERAVASLLGAVALAAEPDLTTGAVPSARPAADWTTTGVLDAVRV